MAKNGTFNYRDRKFQKHLFKQNLPQKSPKHNKQTPKINQKQKHFVAAHLRSMRPAFIS